MGGAVGRRRLRLAFQLCGTINRPSGKGREAPQTQPLAQLSPAGSETTDFSIREKTCAEGPLAITSQSAATGYVAFGWLIDPRIDDDPFGGARDAR